MIIAIIIFISFVFTPFHSDIKVYLGAAHQADFGKSSSKLYNILSAWELKGFLQRIYNWILLKVGTSTADFSSLDFERKIKFFYIVFSSFLIGICVTIWKNTYKNLNILAFFLATFIILFGNAQTTHLQAEMNAVIMMWLAFTIFYNSRSILFILLSGVIFGSLIFMKSNFPIMGITFLVGYFYLKDNLYSRQEIVRKIGLFMLGCVIICLTGFVFLYNFYPIEFDDIKDTVYFQKTIFTDTINPKKMMLKFSLSFFKYALYYLPALTIGSGLFFYKFYKLLKQKNYQKLILLLALFIAPLLFIIISNLYHRYHYYLFAFPYLIVLTDEIISEKKSEINVNKYDLIVQIFTLLIVVLASFIVIENYTDHNFKLSLLFLITNLILVFIFYYLRKINFITVTTSFLAIPLLCYLCFISFESIFFKRCIQWETKARMNNKKVIANLGLNKEESVMYLDPGRMAYFVGNPSYSRYVFPAPLQRKNENIKHLNSYKKSLKEFQHYRGKYITVEDWWMKLSPINDIIYKKIETEYYPIAIKLQYSPIIEVYDTGIKDSNIHNGWVTIYKRKY